MAIKSKPCKWCGDTRHFSFQCRDNPKVQARIKASYEKKPTKPLKRSTIKVKIDEKWEATKKLWFELNPPDHSGYYYCQLVPCLCPGVPMTKGECRLDHIKPKGKYPLLKYVLSNLRPAHDFCNGFKGSLSDEQYKEKAYKYLRTKNSWLT